MIPRLIGMVHLRPLPGAPGFTGDIEEIESAALADATTLQQAGFDGLMIENFGDAPFFAETVPQVTVAAMGRIATAVRRSVDLALGINVLRNDAMAALAVASASGAEYIRVNVLSGAMFTDQGLIQGRAAEIARARQALCPHVGILADVFVKHAAPPAGATLRESAIDTAERAGADAIIVSGTSTGSATDPTELDDVRKAVPDIPLLVGSGVTAATVADYLGRSDGVIAGSSLKPGANPARPVDPHLASEFVKAASSS